jgi:hypothetical protein
MDNGVAARHSSATAEHYTPAYIVEAARATLGAIDFDPFSCASANATVRAEQYTTASNGGDGFAVDWHGRVFVNPPGGKGDGNQSNQKRAWFKMMSEAEARRVEAGIFVCFSVELLQTTQVSPTGPIPLDFPICYPRTRVAYMREDGTKGASPPHSSCVILYPGERDLRGYLERVERFRAAFGAIGRVVVPS